MLSQISTKDPIFSQFLMWRFTKRYKHISTPKMFNFSQISFTAAQKTSQKPLPPSYTREFKVSHRFSSICQHDGIET